MKQAVRTLYLGKDGFALPLEPVTSTQAILAQAQRQKLHRLGPGRGAARSRTADRGDRPDGRVVGLRSSAAGDGPGYEAVVFGGDHADAPLEPQAGRMPAQALVEHGFSALFDVGLMPMDDQLRFVQDFAGELLRINRTALYLFLDEADAFAPRLLESRARKLCLGTISHWVKQGGIRGVGGTMITQRRT